MDLRILATYGHIMDVYVSSFIHQIPRLVYILYCTPQKSKVKHENTIEARKRSSEDSELENCRFSCFMYRYESAMNSSSESSVHFHGQGSTRKFFQGYVLT